MAIDRPHFGNALAVVARGRELPVPGGVLIVDEREEVVGAVGVSGDTSCADHNIAWKTRKLLGMNVTPTNDNISYAAGAHPTCVGGETPPAP